MAQQILIAHLPHVRTERDEDFVMGGGFVTKLPWQQFDDLTQGAFTDWQRKYEACDPVFFWYQEDAELPFVRPGAAQGMEETKLNPASWDELLPRLGYGLIAAFHDTLVDPVWAALALAAPAGIAAAPRSSVTFWLLVRTLGKRLPGAS